MRQVKWLRRALKNLESIHAYISQEEPSAAVRVLNKIRAGVGMVKEFPLMGRTGRVDETRELVIGNTPYIVVYRVKDDVIEVLRVLHSARKFPES